MPAAVCKKAVSHAWLMQRGSEQSAVFHTYTEAPQGTLPRAARALRCLLAVRCLLQRECLLGPRVAGHKRTSSCLHAGSHVPCAHQNWMLGLQQFPQSAAWRPSSTTHLRPVPSCHDTRQAQSSSRSCSSPLLSRRAAAQPGSDRFPGTHRGMPAGPGWL